MTSEEIDDIVVAIMINDGPDGHCDGHEIITAFICALLEGSGNKWLLNYNSRNAEYVTKKSLLAEELARFSRLYGKDKENNP
jgi:hypothetical protein